ncbi:unnamed protein product [Phytophthora fragariaefolia]|uniref:Unnamed protein product n=1 Tax=Phytophthora fragariaefolia TaxID=1490495 RepID=A0A9W7D265_9STRA|nr:unnamed protein product [Phytophthora fragariaefolia]
MTDTGIRVKLDTTDATATAKPSMSDAGICVKPTIANVASRNLMKAFFKSNPNWASVGINPVKRDGRDDDKHVIRENGSIRSYKLTWFIIQNKNLLFANELERQTTPLLKNGKEYRGGYLWIDGKIRIDVFGVDSNKHHPAVQNDFDWIATLERFLPIVKEKGLSLVSKYGNG